MSSAAAGWLQVGLLVVALAVCYKPLGDYMARIFTSQKHWRVERGIYKVIGVDPDADQKWSTYLRSMLAFSIMSVLAVYLLERIQDHLMLSLGMTRVPPALAWNTAVSFTTNTNWQNYSGESTMGYIVQMCGLAVQNFASAAVGIAIAIALVRGFMRRKTDRLGNFWVDLTRCTLRLLLPLAFAGALILAAGGAIDNFHAFHAVHTLAGGQQTMVGGPVASQEVIKEMGNNGGGFFNANSSHPFENPNPFTNVFEIFLYPGHPVLADAHVRQDGRGHAAGLCAARRDGGDLARGRGRHQLLRGAARRSRAAGGARRDGGQGGQVRHPRLVAVRRVDDGDIHRCGELLP